MILIQSWKQASKNAHAVRKKVFIEEQGVPQDLELDEFDPICWHAIAFEGSQCIGTGRLVPMGVNQGQIGRMAVLPQFRGKGIGKAILIKLIELAKTQKISSLILHSQVPAIPFYEKYGFNPQGPIYEEAGIDHRNMILLLPISR